MQGVTSETLTEDFLIKNLSPILYNNPINKEEDLLSFISSQNERRLSIKKKYGNYPEFCTRNKCIPVPYEVIIFLDENIDDDKWDKINYYVTEGYSVGVCCMFFNKGNSIDNYRLYLETTGNIPFIYNSLTNCFYGDKTEIPWRFNGALARHTGAFVFYGKQQNENTNSSYTNDVKLLDVPMEGDYEVVLRMDKYSSADVVDKAFQILSIPGIYRNDSIIILASLSSKKACYDFIKPKIRR